MSKHVKYVTLTPEEREQVTGSRSPSSSASPPTPISSPKDVELEVTMPDGTPCKIRYSGYSTFHCFDYQSPLYISHSYQGTLADKVAVQQKAQELVLEVLQQAQQREQKRMQSVRGSGKTVSEKEARMSKENAETYGGKYSPCFRFASGKMLRIGGIYDTPAEAAREIQEGKHNHVLLSDTQEIVIGICSRAERKWQEPEFLVERVRRTASSETTEEAKPIPKRTRRKT